MEDKYYIPGIEELYIGFECEIYAQNSSKLIKQVNWHQVEVSFSPKMSNYVGLNQCPKLIKTHHIRVKYLDQEDIENLGFIFYKKVEENFSLNTICLLFSNETLNILLGYYPELKRITIITKDPSKNDIYTKTSEDPNKISLIKIKNKSELKKLLKQLNIK